MIEKQDKQISSQMNQISDLNDIIKQKLLDIKKLQTAVEEIEMVSQDLKI